jgi:hypothetical protein
MNNLFYIIFIFYFILCGVFLNRSKFVQSTGITFYQILTAFSVKVIVGCFYGYYFSGQAHIENSDTWSYYVYSLEETDLLLNKPSYFFSSLLESNYSSLGSLFNSSNSYWNDLKNNFFIKILAIINLFSFKNYYVNVIFMNFFFIFPILALYKIVLEKFVVNKILLYLVIFFSPSFLFWCSALHKDGIIFCCIILILFCLERILNESKNFKYYAVLMISVSILFILRNYYLLALLPSCLAWFFLSKLTHKKSILYFCVNSICLLLILFSSVLPYTRPIADSIILKHNDFKLLEGNTRFITPILESNYLSFFNYLPIAFYNVLLRPTFGYPLLRFENLIALESILCFLLIIPALIKITLQYKQKVYSDFFLVSMYTSFFILFFIGYTVCFSGAISRYRGAILPLYILPCFIIIFGKSKSKKIN